MVNSTHKKAVSLFISVLMMGEAGLLPAAQSNLWTERQQAKRLQSKQKSWQLAMAPATGIAADALSNLTGVAALGQWQDNVSSLPGPFSQESAILPDGLVRSLAPHISQVRFVRKPASPSNKFVVLIQDVHKNNDAQADISQIVSALLRTGKIEAVGLEGMQGPLDFASLRALPEKKVLGHVADELLYSQQITGPAHAALSTPGPLPPFIGVDDAQRHSANVAAFQKASLKRLSDRAHWESANQALISEKKITYNERLKRFDDLVHAHRAGKLTFGDYVLAMANQGEAPLPAVSHFLEALKKEGKLNYAAVEKERAEVVQRLVGLLSTQELQDLSSMGAAYRLGRIGHSVFYRHFTALAEGKGLSLGGYPAFSAYVGYVFAADRIDSTALLSEIQTLEGRVYQRLAETPLETSLIRKDRCAFLSGRLLDFALTRKEWKSFRGMRGAAGDILSGVDLSPYEQFYEEADARDSVMADRLLAALDQKNGSSAVLVAGGYHSDGLAQRLASKGYTVVALAPRLTKVDAEGAIRALSVFLRDKSPLESLGQAEKLFLGDHPCPPAAMLRGGFGYVASMEWNSPAPAAVDQDRLALAVPRWAPSIRVNAVRREQTVSVQALGRKSGQKREIHFKFAQSGSYEVSEIKKAPQGNLAASILDKWARPLLGKDTAAYKAYTTAGVAWETVFQWPVQLVFMATQDVWLGALAAVIFGVVFALAHPGRSWKARGVIAVLGTGLGGIMLVGSCLGWNPWVQALVVSIVHGLYNAAALRFGWTLLSITDGDTTRFIDFLRERITLALDRAQRREWESAISLMETCMNQARERLKQAPDQEIRAAVYDIEKIYDKLLDNYIIFRLRRIQRAFEHNRQEDSIRDMRSLVEDARVRRRGFSGLDERTLQELDNAFKVLRTQYFESLRSEDALTPARIRDDASLLGLTQDQIDVIDMYLELSKQPTHVTPGRLAEGFGGSDEWNDRVESALIELMMLFGDDVYSTLFKIEDDLRANELEAMALAGISQEEFDDWIARARTYQEFERHVMARTRASVASVVERLQNLSPPVNQRSFIGIREGLRKIRKPLVLEVNGEVWPVLLRPGLTFGENELNTMQLWRQDIERELREFATAVSSADRDTLKARFDQAGDLKGANVYRISLNHFRLYALANLTERTIVLLDFLPTADIKRGGNDKQMDPKKEKELVRYAENLKGAKNLSPMTFRPVHQPLSETASILDKWARPLLGKDTAAYKAYTTAGVAWETVFQWPVQLVFMATQDVWLGALAAVIFGVVFALAHPGRSWKARGVIAVLGTGLGGIMLVGSCLGWNPWVQALVVSIVHGLYNAAALRFGWTLLSLMDDMRPQMEEKVTARSLERAVSRILKARAAAGAGPTDPGVHRRAVDIGKNPERLQNVLDQTLLLLHADNLDEAAMLRLEALASHQRWGRIVRAYLNGFVRTGLNPESHGLVAHWQRRAKALQGTPAVQAWRPLTDLVRGFPGLETGRPIRVRFTDGRESKTIYRGLERGYALGESVPLGLITEGGQVLPSDTIDAVMLLGSDGGTALDFSQAVAGALIRAMEDSGRGREVFQDVAALVVRNAFTPLGTTQDAWMNLMGRLDRVSPKLLAEVLYKEVDRLARSSPESPHGIGRMVGFGLSVKDFEFVKAVKGFWKRPDASWDSLPMHLQQLRRQRDYDGQGKVSVTAIEFLNAYLKARPEAFDQEMAGELLNAAAKVPDNTMAVPLLRNLLRDFPGGSAELMALAVNMNSPETLLFLATQLDGNLIQDKTFLSYMAPWLEKNFTAARESRFSPKNQMAFRNVASLVVKVLQTDPRALSDRVLLSVLECPEDVLDWASDDEFVASIPGVPIGTEDPRWRALEELGRRARRDPASEITGTLIRLVEKSSTSGKLQRAVLWHLARWHDMPSASSYLESLTGGNYIQWDRLNGISISDKAGHRYTLRVAHLGVGETYVAVDGFSGQGSQARRWEIGPSDSGYLYGELAENENTVAYAYFQDKWQPLVEEHLSREQLAAWMGRTSFFSTETLPALRRGGIYAGLVGALSQVFPHEVEVTIESIIEPASLEAMAAGGDFLQTPLGFPWMRSGWRVLKDEVDSFERPRVILKRTPNVPSKNRPGLPSRSGGGSRSSDTRTAIAGALLSLSFLAGPAPVDSHAAAQPASPLKPRVEEILATLPRFSLYEESGAFGVPALLAQAAEDDPKLLEAALKESLKTREASSGDLDPAEVLESFHRASIAHGGSNIISALGLDAQQTVEVQSVALIVINDHRDLNTARAVVAARNGQPVVLAGPPAMRDELMALAGNSRDMVMVKTDDLLLRAGLEGEQVLSLTRLDKLSSEALSELASKGHIKGEANIRLAIPTGVFVSFQGLPGLDQWNTPLARAIAVISDALSARKVDWKTLEQEGAVARLVARAA